MKEPTETVQLEALLETLGSFEVVDLSHSLEEQIPVWPGLSKYYHTLWGAIHYGDGATAYQLIMSEHTGTHVDVPGHYMPPGHPHHKWADEVPLTSWMGRAALLDCAQQQPATRVPASAVLEWEDRHGRVKAGDIVLFSFGWFRRWAVRPDG
ncbi:MAG: cyclase family protein, partial [Chloroflexota bacterium]|nr:cyclase family protein [Chloroflexota bacterium]